MKKLDLVIYGTPKLTEPSSEILTFDKEIDEMSEEMYYTMHKENGVGLAAPQIGVNKKLCVIGIQEKGQEIKLTLINPEIVEVFGEDILFEEGCLSVPGISAPVLRPSGIVVQAYDIHGKPIKIRTDGMLARVIQHELDHLNGTLFVDRLSKEAYMQLEHSLKKLSKKTKKRLKIS